MNNWSRRQFLKATAGLPTLAMTGCAGSRLSSSAPHVVVVGGGFGGATAAKTIRQLDPGIRVTLIEPKSRYITCPASNWLWAGLVTMESLTVDYRALCERYDVQWLQDTVTAIDAERRQVRVSGSQTVCYDRLIVSPGIDFRWQAIAGLNAETAQQFPHAWQAGVQTAMLQQQLQAMDDGGVLLICPPADPYRCPPGPYERTSLIAHWLQRHKPRSKILILDPKNSFSKQKLFETVWARHYGYGSDNSLIERHVLTDNPIVELDAKGKAVITEFGDRFHGDVINLIPPQQAASIAVETGLVNTDGWCPIIPQTSASTMYRNIHVIGDAGQFAPMPKSAFSANSQAKTCALAVVGLLREKPLPESHWLNICYSLVTPEQGISIAMTYKVDSQQGIVAVKGAGGVSQRDDAESLAAEARYAQSAYRNLRADSFGV